MGGTEYTKAQIDAELGVVPPNVVAQKDTNGHGTHCAGTCCGVPFSSKGYAEAIVQRM